MAAADSKNQKWKLERRRGRLARRLMMFGVTNDINLLRHRLETEQKRLMQELEGLKTKHATEIAEVERRALEKFLGDRLAEVERALHKLDHQGTYGLCDNCGQPIEPARLEALPQASLCLSCKAHQEKRAKFPQARQEERIACPNEKVTQTIADWVERLVEDRDSLSKEGQEWLGKHPGKRKRRK